MLADLQQDYSGSQKGVNPVIISCLLIYLPGGLLPEFSV